MSDELCNSSIFSFQEGFSELYAIIGLNLALLMFFLVMICRLCSIAFSYSNFHVHETYKFYGLTIISIVLTILSRFIQMEYNNVRKHGPDTADAPEVEGYRIMNEVVGVISVYVSNMVYLMNGFTWLTIVLGCDSISDRDSNTEERQYREKQRAKRRNRFIIRTTKNIMLYALMPGFLILSIVGTLEQTQDWCESVSLLILITTAISLLLFLVALIIFLCLRFNNERTSLKAKIALIYLAVSMICRFGYFLLMFFNPNRDEINLGLLITYIILCTVLPLLAMSFLAENQLEKEKCVFLKRSEVLMLKSTILL